MTKYNTLLIIFLCCFVACNRLVENRLELKHCSVRVPEKWKIVRDENEITFINPGAKFEEIYINISEHETNGPLSLEDTWTIIKPTIIQNKTLISEGEQMIAGAKWKEITIETRMESLELRTAVLFTIKDSIKYSFQFACPKDKWSENLSYFKAVQKSFKFM